MANEAGMSERRKQAGEDVFIPHRLPRSTRSPEHTTIAGADAWR